MRIVVVGATGNVGTSLLDAPVADPQVNSVLGVARRLPQLRLPKRRLVGGRPKPNSVERVPVASGSG